jgi:hypothetical protein
MLVSTGSRKISVKKKNTREYFSQFAL